MTMTPLSFDKLSGGKTLPSTLLLTRERLHAIRSEALETGRNEASVQFRAGENAARKKAIAALERAASDMTFTHVEARQAVLSSLAPLLTEVFSKVLPQVAQAALPQIIAEEVGKIVNKAQSGPIRVGCAPDLVEAVSSILSEETANLEVKVQADPSLAEGQCQINGPHIELDIDMPRVLAEMTEALTSFSESLIEETSHVG